MLSPTFLGRHRLSPDQSSCGSVQITVQKLQDSHRTDADWRRKKPGPSPDPDPGPAVRPAAQSRPGEELLTSCFTAGERGVVLGALRQRSQSAPHRKEVQVQLLDPGLLQITTPRAGSAVTHHGGAEPSSNCLGDASDAAASAAAAAAASAAAAAAVAAAAPLIRAQSDMEARVSQLADGIQKLLHTNREDPGRGRSLSQQTLEHLETLQSQQLQLQSQLLESAIKIVTGHASVQSDRTAASHHQGVAANIVSNQQPSSSGTRRPAPVFTAVETAPVTLETCHNDRWPDNTSLKDNLHLQGLADESQEAVSRANQMLREMRCLKDEMKMLLKQPEDSAEVTEPALDPLQVPQIPPQSQQNQTQQTLFQNNYLQPRPSHLEQKRSRQNTSQQLQSHQKQSEFLNLRSNQKVSHQTHLTCHQGPLHPIQSQENQSQQSHQSQSGLAQRRPRGPSTLEEAGRVLRQARRRKKVLDENLEVLLKAKTGEILQCQLDALAANRDWTEEVRIKKTVDAWISCSARDVQTRPAPRHADVGSDDVIDRRSAKGVTSSRPKTTGRGAPVNMLRGAGRTPATGRGGGGSAAGPRLLQDAGPARATGEQQADSRQVEDHAESYLTHLYGKVPYDGLRRTLKKSPYPRFRSPVSPVSRKSRPRLVESVKGVKLKSCKTQTSFAPPLSLTPEQPYVISSTPLTSQYPAHITVTNADNSPVAMAIPLGRPKVLSFSPSERAQNATSALHAPLSASVVAVDNRSPEREMQQMNAKAPPVDDRAPGGGRRRRRRREHLPGNDLSVANAVQEEASLVGEDAVVLDGRPSPAPVLYHGPAFPPEAPSSCHVQNQTPVLDVDQQQDALEERLVKWVGQQLMSRVIADIYHPPLSDPAQNDHTDQSEPEERSFTSDIVEAAGGGGLQLFVDSNISVDSELIRKLVHEVLTETLSQMLGQRNELDAKPEPGQDAPKPGPAAQEEDKQVPVVPTPVPTPVPSEDPSSKESTPVTTPAPSEPASPLSEKSPQPITAPDLIATPPSSPKPLPAVEAPPPVTLGNPELPLDKERPEDVALNEQQLISVAEEEPPPCSPLPAPSLPPATAPPCSSPEDPTSTSITSTPSSSSISCTVTVGTEAALKHISEGELLISVNQTVPLTEEEVGCSFSSSLQELQDMDLDPPTIEQIRDHDLLDLLTRMDGDVSLRGNQTHAEEDLSLGEVRDYDSQLDQNSSQRQTRQAAVGRQEGGTRKMDVHLPSVRPLEEEEEEEEEVGEELSEAAYSHSSTSDVF
ncbi:LOW QUALITY PROTEIN: protein TALPID3 [Cololabis saira]|uniref:LOW QUALITY PROTEIN: protein TALPID3 n=1 Tax=Cololabis saira TaxID=129043 RepID=UPI002AD5379B|nr:LOW QUALITY PROTEIN: protein TALPID3 [Cololabis saira]